MDLKKQQTILGGSMPNDKTVTTRELKILGEGNTWREYVIYSQVGRDKFFQGTLSLPFNKEAEGNSLEILEKIKEALK